MPSPHPSARTCASADPRFPAAEREARPVGRRVSAAGLGSPSAELEAPPPASPDPLPAAGAG